MWSEGHPQGPHTVTASWWKQKPHLASYKDNLLTDLLATVSNGNVPTTRRPSGKEVSYGGSPWAVSQSLNQAHLNFSVLFVFDQLPYRT